MLARLRLPLTRPTTPPLSCANKRPSTQLTAFGFHFHEAPGEAEAELAQLNMSGRLDVIISEDSDTFLFGAQCVIRTTGPSVQHDCIIYTRESIENTDSVSLNRDGMILCVLLLGGDYGPGISGIGPAIAHALAIHGFGHELTHILRHSRGPALHHHLSLWRNSLRQELRTNSARRLEKRQPKLANNISDTFPNLKIADLYLNPLTSSSPGFTGRAPEYTRWKPREPDIFKISQLCSTRFGWVGEHLLKKLAANLWPAATFQLISSRYILYDTSRKLFASPTSQAKLLKIKKAALRNRAFSDSSELDVRRVWVSDSNFTALAQLTDVSTMAEGDIKLVSIPAAILAVAMRDVASETTNLSDVPGLSSDNDHDSSEGGGQCIVDVMDSDEEDLIIAHSALVPEGIIDLTED
ncbi:hypothetical protein K438DRAFT_2025002 [Mycena galopus ATCC 62051]|nr:hypothetical protein K438DRAFT_2025002 [Mycena galopus ATCC 62051]